MDKNKQQTILVTGVGGPAGVNTVRLLSAYPQHRIIGCDIDALAAGQSYVETFVISPRVSDPLYLTWLQDLIECEGVTLVVPTVHEELIVLRDFTAPETCTVVLSGPESLVVGDNKQAFYTWVEKNYSEHAIIWTPISAWTPDWLEDAVQFIKPTQGRGARGCRTITKDELIREQSYLSEDTLVMKYMPGTEWTVDVYVSREGTVIYAVPRERIGLAGGISIKGRTVRHAEIEALASQVALALGCRGPVCIQLRADANGTPRLIEINPRLSGGLPITVAAGANPIDLILREVAGETLRPISWNEVTVVGHFEYKQL